MSSSSWQHKLGVSAVLTLAVSAWNYILAQLVRTVSSQGVPVSRDCDFVLVWKNQPNLKLIAALEAQGLKLKDLETRTAKMYGITADFPLLARIAEEISITKSLRRGAARPVSEFQLQHADAFQGFKESSDFFTMAERQMCIHHVLTDYQYCGLEIHQALESQEISSLFSLHDDAVKKKLLDDWLWNSGDSQVLDRIKDYFGTEIGFYFSWLSFYSGWLFFPALFGLTAYVFEAGKGYEKIDAIYLLFTSIYVTFFLQFWTRRSNEISWNWGSPESDDFQPCRPRFKGELKFDIVTNRRRLWYSPVLRYAKYAITVPICLGTVLTVAGLMLLSFEMEGYLKTKFGAASLLAYIPSVLYCLFS